MLFCVLILKNSKSIGMLAWHTQSSGFYPHTWCGGTHMQFQFMGQQEDQKFIVVICMQLRQPGVCKTLYLSSPCIYTHAYTHAQIQTHIYTCSHVNIYKLIYIHAYTCIHTFNQASFIEYQLCAKCCCKSFHIFPLSPNPISQVF